MDPLLLERALNSVDVFLAKYVSGLNMAGPLSEVDVLYICEFLHMKEVLRRASANHPKD